MATELGVAAIDDHTLEVTVASPMSYFPLTTTHASTFPSPAWVIEVVSKVIWGWFSTSRKSALRRWLSRSSLRVSMLLAWMVSSRLELVGSVASKRTVRVTLSVLPAASVAVTVYS